MVKKKAFSVVRWLAFTLVVSGCLASNVRSDPCGVPTFGPHLVGAMSNGVFLATGDFNLDGKPDLAVVKSAFAAGAMRDGISVLLGNGDGTFQPAVSYPSGTNPVFITVADFNGDGKPDLAVANVGDANAPTDAGISIWLGNGDGSLRAGNHYPAGPGKGLSRAGLLWAADLNGDGKLDLVVAPVTSGGDSLWILFGNGDGSFQAPSLLQSSEPAAALSFVVSDFNGDGKPDLALASVSSMSVLLGNGDGTFRTITHNDEPAWTLAVGDFNKDGRPDLAVFDAGSPNTTVSVLLGKGDGTFQKLPCSEPLLRPFPAGSIFVSDINQDGAQDLIVAQDGASPPLLLLGNGDSTFHRASLNVGGPFLAVADFNGDGRPDLAWTASSSSGVALNNGTASSPSLSFALSGQVDSYESGWAIAFGDLNGDGQLDLIQSESTSVSIVLGGKDGSFIAGTNLEVGDIVCRVATGDFNHDGKLDLAVLSEGKYDATLGGINGADLRVFLGKGDGSFGPPARSHLPSSSYNWTAIVVEDLNRDGNPDLAVMLAPKNLWLLYGNSDGTFQSPIVSGVDVTGFREMGAMDLNRDGNADLLLLADDAVWVFLGKGDATFQPGTPYALRQGSDQSSLLIADFDGDGQDDLAVVGPKLSVFLAKGDGTFKPPIASDLPEGLVAVADFDADGIPDLLVGSVSALNYVPASLLLGVGDGTFRVASSRPFDFISAFPNREENRLVALAARDLNGDGLPDFIAITSSFSIFDGTWVWLNTTCSTQPRLSIKREGPVLNLSAPLALPGYVLESAPILAPAIWKTVAPLAISNSPSWKVPLRTDAGSVYFRLHKP